MLFCVNALQRATIISTNNALTLVNSANVSMPYTGLPSFLHSKELANKTTDTVVSMPYNGLPSFLHRKAYKEIKHNCCVNALQRATIISTLPSGNPVFSRVSRLDFAGNYQNILTISVFRPIFVLRRNLCIFASFSITISRRIVNYFFIITYFSSH